MKLKSLAAIPFFLLTIKTLVCAQPNQDFEVVVGVSATFQSQPSSCGGPACGGLPCAGGSGIMYGLREGAGATVWPEIGNGTVAVFPRTYNTPGTYLLSHRTRVIAATPGICVWSIGTDTEYGTYTINVVNNIAWTNTLPEYICNNQVIDLANYVSQQNNIQLVIDGVVQAGTIFNASSVSLGSHAIAVRKTYYNSISTLSSQIVTVVGTANVLTNPSDMTVCPGSSIMLGTVASGGGLSFTWQESTNQGTTWSNVSNGGVFINANTNTLTISDVTGRGGYLYRLAAANACNTDYSNAATITLRPPVQINNQPADVFACPGTNQSFTVSAIAQTGTLSYQWQLRSPTGAWENPPDGPGSGFTNSASATVNVSNVTEQLNGYQFRCIVTDGCGAVNQTISAPATLTVQALTITENPQPQAACTGGTVVFSVNANVRYGSLQRQWQISTNGGASWVSPGGATGSTFQVSGVQASQNGTLYRCRLFTGCGVTHAFTPWAALTVHSIQVTNQPTPQAVCQGSNLVYSVSASSTNGPLTYQWQTSDASGNNSSNLPPASPFFSGTQTSTLTVNSETVSQWPANTHVRCRILDACNNEIFTTPVGFSIFPAPQITTHPLDQAVCPGTASFSVAGSAGNGALNHQWQVSTDGGASYADVSDGGIYAGANTQTLNLNGVDETHHGWRFRLRLGDACGAATEVFSNPATLTVNSLSITNHPADATVCPGSTAVFSVDALSNIPLTYQWQWQFTPSGAWNDLTGNSLPGGTSVNGATTASLTLSNVGSAVEEFRFRCRITNTCGDVFSNPAEIGIQGPVSITAQPNSQTVCAGANADYYAFGTGNGMVVFQWQVSSNGGITYEPISISNSTYSGVNTATLTVHNVSANLAPDLAALRFRCRLQDACGATTEAFTAPATIALFLQPSVSSHPADQTVCPGASSFSVVGSPGNGVLNYQWQVSTDGGGSYTNVSDGGIYTGANTQTLDLNSLDGTYDGWRFRARLNDACGDLNEVFSNHAILDIINAPEVTAQPLNTAICPNGNATFDVSVSGQGGLTYAWQLSAGEGSPFSDLSDGGVYGGVNTATLTLTNTPASFSNYQFRARLTNCGGEVFSDVATLTLNTPVAITSQPADDFKCEGSNASFSATGTGSELSYQWQVSSDNGNTFQDVGNSDVYAGSTSNTLVINSVPLGLSSNRYRLSVSGACNQSLTNSAVLTVSAKPAVPTAADAARCGDGTLSVTASSDVTSPTFHWYANQNDVAPLFSGPTLEVNNLTSTKVYYVAVAELCQSDKKPVTFTRHDYEDVPLGSALTLCIAQAPYNLENDITAEVARGSVFTWTSDGNTFNSNQFDPAIGLGTYTVTYEPPLVAQNAPHCYTTTTRSIQVTNTIGEGGITFNGDKVVNGNTINLCVGDNAVALTQLPSLSGGSWSTVSGSGLSTAAPEFVPGGNALTSDQPNVVRYTLNVNGCIASKDLNVFVRDNQQVPVIAGVPTIVCPGTTINIGASVAGQGNFNFNFYRQGEINAFATTANLAYPVTTQEVLEVRSIDVQSGCHSQPALVALNTPVQATGIVVDKATIDQGESVQFSTDAPASSTFHWVFGDGATSTESAPVHKYLEPGEFLVEVTISQNPDCPQKLAYDKIVVNGIPVTSLEDKVPGTSIYPNPVTNYLNIVSESPVVEAQVFDLSGKKLTLNSRGNEHEIAIDVNSIQPGLFFLVLTTKNGKHIVKVNKQ